MGIVTAEVQGLGEALKRFDRLEQAYGRRGERLGPVLVRAAKLIRTKVRDVTPVGPTGNLRRMIGASLYKRYEPNKPTAYVHAFAPHAHLVELGHIGPGGNHVPPHPFFARGVQAGASIAMKMIANEVGKLLKESTKR